VTPARAARRARTGATKARPEPRGDDGDRGPDGDAEREREAAAERLLDAAERAFVTHGVSAAGMAEIARAAGCSRGTLYRHFPSRHALHLAYVDREARAIVARVRAGLADVADPHERAVRFVLDVLREVRAKPGTAAWFEPGASGMAARMSRASEVIAALAAGFADAWLARRPASDAPSRADAGDAPSRADADDAPSRADAGESALRARWLVRVVVSLLADPEEDAARERALVERFVAPLLRA